MSRRQRIVPRLTLAVLAVAYLWTMWTLGPGALEATLTVLVP